MLRRIRGIGMNGIPFAVGNIPDGVSMFRVDRKVVFVI